MRPPLSEIFGRVALAGALIFSAGACTNTQPIPRPTALSETTPIPFAPGRTYKDLAEIAPGLDNVQLARLAIRPPAQNTSEITMYTTTTDGISPQAIAEYYNIFEILATQGITMSYQTPIPDLAPIALAIEPEVNHEKILIYGDIPAEESDITQTGRTLIGKDRPLTITILPSQPNTQAAHYNLVRQICNATMNVRPANLPELDARVAHQLACGSIARASFFRRRGFDYSNYVYSIGADTETGIQLNGQPIFDTGIAEAVYLQLPESSPITIPPPGTRADATLSNERIGLN